MNGVRKKELADLIGCHSETITNYQKEGMPYTGKGASLRFDTVECIKWVRENDKQKAVRNIQKPENSRTIEDSKFRKEEANALMAELEVAEKMKLVVSREQSLKELEAWTNPMLKKLQAIPSSWATYVVGIKSAADAIDVLTIRVNKLLEDLSNTEPEEYDLETAIEEVDVGDTEDV